MHLRDVSEITVTKPTRNYVFRNTLLKSGFLIMKRLIALFALTASLPLMAQQYKMAVIGLVHSHVWGHLNTMVAERKRQARRHRRAECGTDGGGEEGSRTRRQRAGSFYDDYKKMLAEARPDFVWAFVENNRHREIVEACAPRKIHVIFEKPLASTYKDALAIRGWPSSTASR